jgi:hypothetical protein
METTELLRPALAASECTADAIRQNNANVSAVNKAEIITELENMIAARRLLLADREITSAYHHKLIQMGLVEQVCAKPETWRNTSLGEELDIDLLQVFMGLWCEWEVPLILEEYGLLTESEFDAILECMTEANAERVLSVCVKRAYFDYRNAAKFLH